MSKILDFFRRKKLSAEVAGPVHAVSLIGTSYCGSSLFNLIMGAHPEIIGGGEVYRLLDKPLRTNCGQCGKSCRYWNYARRRHIKEGNFYREIARLFGKRFIVDTSKGIKHFERMENTGGADERTYVVLYKHPLRQLASFVDNQFYRDKELFRLSGDLREFETAVRAHTGELLDFVDAKISFIRRKYGHWFERGVPGSKPQDIIYLKYEDMILNPASALSPVLEGMGLAYAPEMDNFMAAEQHTLGGNSGPRHQSKRLGPKNKDGEWKKTNMSEARRAFYSDSKVLKLDNKYESIFLPEHLEVVVKRPNYIELCAFMSYPEDAMQRAA